MVTINERKDSTAALLDVASAMTGIGVVIHEAIIQVPFPPVTHVNSARRCVPLSPAMSACSDSYALWKNDTAALMDAILISLDMGTPSLLRVCWMGTWNCFNSL